MTHPATAASIARTNNLALAYQEVFTVVLRTRFDIQTWPSADRMRSALRQMIAAGSQNLRAMGYSDEITQMGLYAMVGFVDENVLSSRNPIFAEWHGFPLQQELFKTQIAGEIFFRHIADLLQRPDTADVADMLEMHCLCLLLGFRGRFARGDASEIDNLVRRIREKILRIRGPLLLVQETEVPAVIAPPTKDKWLRYLTISTIAVAALTLLAFAGYLLLLNQGMPQAQGLPQAALGNHAPPPFHLSRPAQEVRL